MDFKRILFRTALLFGAAALLLSAGCSLPGAQAGEFDGGADRAVTTTAQANQMASGTDPDGYFWFIWKDNNGGSATITHDTTPGNYSTSWTNIGNFTSGKGWATGTTNRVISYSGAFNGGNNGYLAVYGWMENPLVEYYILDTWGNWDPKTDSNLTSKNATVTSDGGTYNVYTAQRTNAANITGTNANFTQYWSIRTSKRSIPATGSGTNTITTAEHFTKWQQLGMTLGTFASRDYQVMETEGYQSSGSSNITIGSGSSPVKTWQTLGTGTNGNVHALAVYSGNLYAGGYFTTAGNVSANRIAKYSGTTWSALGSGMGSAVDALACNSGNGALFAGGAFSTPSPYFSRWLNSSWSGYGTGMDGNVKALAFGSNKLYAGGVFTTAGGVSVNKLAQWNGTAWSALGSFGSGLADVQVQALAYSGSDLYVAWSHRVNTGGRIPTTNYKVSKWNGSSWSDLGGIFNSHVAALAVSGSTLYAGGGFTKAGTVVVNALAKWNGSAWSAVGLSGVSSGWVSALVCDSSGNLYTGGAFASIGGVTASNIALWNGSNWSALGSGTNAEVRALALDSSGSLYAGGYFTSPGSHIAVYK